MTGLSDRAIDRLRLVANWPEFDSDRYTVSGEIGRGGMGTVYAARDQALERDVAIKVSNTVASAAFERRLAAEARVLASLEHPGIVPVHDVGRLADGRLFYVMKRVHGRTLAEHVRHGSDLGERLRIFERICEAVAFAHANRILHRDLKPDNIMIGAFGEVMVMDWGVAKSLSVPESPAADHTGAAGAGSSTNLTTNPGMVLGTRGFMAPEQERGAEDVDERADVYALGAILFALLSGGLAPESSGAPYAASKLSSVPPPLRSITGRALASAPDDRYPSVAALARDVASYRAGAAVEAHRETMTERAFRLAKVYRTPILLVLAYMIMRTIVAIVAGW